MARRFTLKARTGGSWSGLEELNDEQRAVVTAPGGPMQVVAGAGSGKTRTLTYRLAWLVRQGVDPARIMLVTFTNRAAREMLSRAVALLDVQVHRVFGGTFHAAANRLLREHGAALGLQPNFAILDSEDSRDLMGRCIDEVVGPSRDRRRRFPRKNVICALASHAANTLQDLDAAVAERFPQLEEELEAIRPVIAAYHEAKRRGHLCDYDDLLGHLLTLLREHPTVRERIQGRFEHVLVDEFQDTNALQGEILAFLVGAHRNLCVVGDDAQSIYAFRGARIENVLGFAERWPGATTFRLETNYRSTPQILALANASIAHNRRRLPKELRAVKRDGALPVLVQPSGAREQARFIADYVLHLLDEGRSLREIAVLYRNHWHSLEIQLELQRSDIPFEVRGGLRFFEQAHIKDVLAHLRIAANPRDELAWFRLLPQLPRVGQATTRRIWAAIEADPIARKDAAATRALLPGAAREGWDRFRDVIDEVVAAPGPGLAIEAVLAGPYDDHLAATFDNPAGRREDLRGLAEFASQYDAVDRFLSELALSGESAGESVLGGRDDEDEALTCSTVHQAKGLEWPVVIVPWLCDGRFPHEASLEDEDGIEEERRVFHVAATRAEDELYLVSPRSYWSRSGLVFMKPSVFLRELPAELLERMELEEAKPEG